MKALSIKQPWAWLIVNGYKDIENRDYPIATRMSLPQRIYIHAGAKVDNEGAIWLWDNKGRLGIQGCMPEWVNICNFWRQGAIVGEVDIFGCVIGDESPWFTGRYGLKMANPVAYEKPIPYKGKLGFFEVNL